MKYKVSVIIPVYNGEHSLNKAIDSLIHQTIGFENIEIIMIDDCSIDNTSTIIKELTKKNKNCKGIFLKKNHGTPSKPRNEGILKSSSEYVLFLDQDDTYEPNSLEVLYNKINQNHLNAVFSNTYQIFNGKKYISNNISNLKKESTIKLDHNLSEIIHSISTVWGAIYRKSFLMEHYIFFPENIFFEDTYFILKIMIFSKEVLFLNNFFGYCWYQNLNSTSHTANKTKIKKWINGLDKIYLMLNKYKNIFDLNNGIILTDFLGIFLKSNIKYSDSIILLKQLNEFEKKMDYKFEIKLLWAKIFNYFIINEYYYFASLMSIIFFRIYKIFKKRIVVLILNKNNTEL